MHLDKEVRVVFRRIAFVLVAAVTLAAVSGSYALAQSGVKGVASIATSNVNVATLNINVVKNGSVLTGGFRYTEVCPISPTNSITRPSCTIYSQQLTSVDVKGNFATVRAIGFWNGMLAEVLVECLDDNPSGDWIHIRAIPIKSAITAFYEASGGVIKGDVAVYGPPAVVGYATGSGTITIPVADSTVPNIGRFSFKAEKTTAGVKGTIYYTESTPYCAVAQRPKVTIYVPAVQGMVIDGRTAVLMGKGTLNGRPAEIEVRAADNSSPMGPATSLDEFHIRAVTLVDDTRMPQYLYEAGGRVRTGDIKVVATWR